MATISGSHGNDKITGTSNDDVLKGNGGNDVINGGKGNDTIKGGTGNDKLYGGGGDDVLSSGYGYDSLYGEEGNDIFKFDQYDSIPFNTYGGSGNDIFNFKFLYSENPGSSGLKQDSEGNFVVDEKIIDYIKTKGIVSSGGPGDDTWFGSGYVNNFNHHYLGAISLGKIDYDLGSGDDLFHMWSKSPLTLKNDKILIDGGSGHDTFVCFGGYEGYGTDFDEYAQGGYSYNLTSYLEVYGIDASNYEWDDLFNHTKNFEALHIQTEHDYQLMLKDEVINNKSSLEISLLDYGGSNSSITIDASDESGASIILKVRGDYHYSWNQDPENISIEHNDTGPYPYSNFKVNFIGGAGDDQLHAQGEGDDIFQGNGGNDYFFGDDGNNTAVFNGKKSQYLIAEIGYNKYLIKDRVKGRDGSDTIENVNTLSFSDGDYDLVIKGLKIEGDGSAEVINGGKNSDYLDGGGGNDKLRGRNGNDTILGGDGNDRLYGDNGNDQLNGGDGIDTVFFSSKSNVVKLFTTKKQNTKDGKDTLIGIENVSAGSGNDKVYGSKGSNVLNGGTGDDLLVGGKGNDKLIGGKGKDIFKLSKGKGYDLIQDFENNKDKIFIGSSKKIKLENESNYVFIYKGKDLLAKVKGAAGDLSKKGSYIV